MENLYKIEKNYAEIILNTKLYPVIAIKKALSNYTKNIYVKIDYEDEKNIKLQIVPKENMIGYYVLCYFAKNVESNSVYIIQMEMKRFILNVILIV